MKRLSFLIRYILTRIPAEPVVLIPVVQQDKWLSCILVCIYVIITNTIFFRMTSTAIQNTSIFINGTKRKRKMVFVWMRLVRIFWNRTIRIERRVEKLLTWRSAQMYSYQSALQYIFVNSVAWTALFVLGMTPVLTSPAIIACSSVRYKEGLVPILAGEVAKYISLFLIV